MTPMPETHDQRRAHSGRTTWNTTHQRRGSAVVVVLLLVLAVTGLGLITMRQGQSEISHGVVATDSQRSLNVADACAAGAVETLPSMLDIYVAEIANGNNIPLVHQQFDGDFLTSEPFGDSQRTADCVVRIIEITEDDPAAGYSTGAACFKRITLEATASVSRTAASSSEISQNHVATVRNVIVRGIFGPVSCN